MSLVSVNEIAEGRESWRDSSGAGYTRVFDVLLDSVSDGPHAARTAVGVPDYGDAHPNNANALAKNIRAVDTDNRMFFKVRVDYATPTSTTTNPDPTDDDPTVEWGSRQIMRVIMRDRDDNPIVNSAFDWFDPPLEEPYYIQTLRITRNETSYDPDTAAGYWNKVNKFACSIAGRWCAYNSALLTTYAATRTSRDGTDYWAVTYELEFDDADFHDRVVLDQGYRHWPSGTVGSGARVPILDGESATTEPMRLDGAGKALAAGTALASSHYRTFVTKDEVAFGPLNLTFTP